MERFNKCSSLWYVRFETPIGVAPSEVWKVSLVMLVVNR